MNYEEQPFFFDCEGESLLGIVARPEVPATAGVLLVVGGPQYRVGSHRQFLLLSRHLAARGVACMRFDCRGMGDSTGPMQTFEAAGPDLRAALDTFLTRVPGLRTVVLWGLCDAASAAALYAAADSRVGGLVLLNPWVRTEAGAATTYLRHYYWRRLFERSFWAKVLRGAFSPAASLRSLAHLLRTARRGQSGPEANPAALGGGEPLPDRMAAALERFRGPLLLVISARDLTAQEFLDAAKGSARWEKALSRDRVTWKSFPDADHTFSTQAQRDAVARCTLEWVSAHFP